MKPIFGAILASLATALPAGAWAQSTTTSTSSTTSSVGCAALTQAAQNAINNTVQANDAYEAQPDSVGALSCLNNFFNGTGLNLITSGLDPAALLSAVEGEAGNQLCSAVQSAWGNAMGGVQCGLSITGINLGLGFGSSSGVMCPTLSFGGGGPPIANSSIGTSTSNNLYINGSAELPTGYTGSVLDGVF